MKTRSAPLDVRDSRALGDHRSAEAGAARGRTDVDVLELGDVAAEPHRAHRRCATVVVGDDVALLSDRVLARAALGELLDDVLGLALLPHPRAHELEDLVERAVARRHGRERPAWR